MTRWLFHQMTVQYRWRKIIMIMIWTCVENLDELVFFRKFRCIWIWNWCFLGSDKLWAERCDQHWRRKVHHHLQWVLQPYSFGVILIDHFEMYSSAMVFKWILYSYIFRHVFWSSVERAQTEELWQYNHVKLKSFLPHFLHVKFDNTTM